MSQRDFSSSCMATWRSRQQKYIIDPHKLLAGSESARLTKPVIHNHWNGP